MFAQHSETLTVCTIFTPGILACASVPAFSPVNLPLIALSAVQSSPATAVKTLTALRIMMAEHSTPMLFNDCHIVPHLLPLSPWTQLPHCHQPTLWSKGAFVLAPSTNNMFQLAHCIVCFEVFRLRTVCSGMAVEYICFSVLLHPENICSLWFRDQQAHDQHFVFSLLLHCFGV